MQHRHGPRLVDADGGETEPPLHRHRPGGCRSAKALTRWRGSPNELVEFQRQIVTEWNRCHGRSDDPVCATRRCSYSAIPADTTLSWRRPSAFVNRPHAAAAKMAANAHPLHPSKRRWLIARGAERLSTSAVGKSRASENVPAAGCVGLALALLVLVPPVLVGEHLA